MMDATKFLKRGVFHGKLVVRRKDGTCQHCDVKILKGDEVLSVEKDSGFFKNFVGLCHVECFEKFQDGYKKKPKENK